MNEMMTEQELNNAAERLRASRTACLQMERENGQFAGRNWILNDADWEEIEAIRPLFDVPDNVDFRGLAAVFGDDGAEFVMRLYGDGEPREPSEEWIAGFVQGAAEAFEAVEPRL